MAKIYLCARIAKDARPLNNQVAELLREAGHECYVPHEQAPNNLSDQDIADGRYDKETIFRLDFSAMNEADICVTVGRLGRDCSWELGWFYAKEIPIIYAPAGDTDYNTSPMLLPSLVFKSAVFMIPEMVRLCEGLKR